MGDQRTQSLFPKLQPSLLPQAITHTHTHTRTHRHTFTHVPTDTHTHTHSHRGRNSIVTPEFQCPGGSGEIFCGWKKSEEEGWRGEDGGGGVVGVLDAFHHKVTCVEEEEKIDCRRSWIGFNLKGRVKRNRLQEKSIVSLTNFLKSCIRVYHILCISKSTYVVHSSSISEYILWSD